MKAVLTKASEEEVGMWTLAAKKVGLSREKWIILHLNAAAEIPPKEGQAPLASAEVASKRFERLRKLT